MHGAIPPLSHTSAWRGAYLSTKDNYTITLDYLLNILIFLLPLFPSIMEANYRSIRPIMYFVTQIKVQMCSGTACSHAGGYQNFGGTC
jgi:hypothetical protein